MKLDRVYSMPELAAMIGWPRHRLVRHLRRMDADCGNTLLRNTARRGTRPCWTTTLDALKRTAPQWFTDSDTVEARLEAVEDAQARDSSVVEMHTQRIVQLAAEVKRLRTANEALARSLKAASGTRAA